jgi:hypothetical protein
MANGPFSKVFHALRDEYYGVWKSDAQLALYVRLLCLANQAYPQMAPIGHRNGAYQSLVKAGLVIENEGATGYTILGLQGERERRSHAARNAAASRWGMPSKEEKSKEEKSNGHPPETFMGWKPRTTPADVLADIERQQAASLVDAIAKAKAREQA